MKVRLQERTHLIYHLRVFDAEEGRMLGHMIEMTPEGMMLIAEEPIPVDKIFSLRMDLPKNLGIERRLAFRAESKWCRKDSTGDFYSMGFRILDMAPEAVTVVRALIKDFYQEDAEEEFESDMNPSL
jgi:hypothetical protein